MLRLIVLVLVLLNAGYFAYVQGFLAAYGFSPATQTEPHRIGQQIRPESLRILNPDVAGQPQTAASPVQNIASAGPIECLQVGVFNDEQTSVLRERVATALPQGSWVIESALEPARWLVYMGRYTSPDAVRKKQSELRGLGVLFEPLNAPRLEPGLSLGSFSNRLDAELALNRIALKGVKTARVIEERAEVRGQRLTLAAVDAALRLQLDSIQPLLASKVLKPCA